MRSLSANAIYNAARYGAALLGCTIYVNRFPCGRSSVKARRFPDVLNRVKEVVGQRVEFGGTGDGITAGFPWTFAHCPVI
jgi:hypothetical protein